MAQDIRVCGGSGEFNSGVSNCPVPRGKIKGLIFVPSGLKLPAEITLASLETAIHADRPNRIYPVKTIDEYAPSGGEAQTSQQGYGASKVTSYSSKVDAFTVDKYDMGLKANVVDAKSMSFDVYLVNDSNIIFGERDNDGSLKGIPLSGIYVGGQDYDSSGQVANLVINIMYSDIEKHWKIEDTRSVDFDIVSALNGLVEVEVKSVTGGYKIIERYGRLDVTPTFGQLIVSNADTTTIPSNVVTSYADGVIVASGVFTLKKPSVLHENGIIGIEQAS
jgi:hypothetical protein